MKDNFVTIHASVLHALIRYIEKSDCPKNKLTNMAARHTRKYNPEYKQKYLAQKALRDQVVSESVAQSKAFLKYHRDKVLRYPGYNYSMSHGLPEEEHLALCDKLRMLKVNKRNGKIVCSVDSGDWKTKIELELSWLLEYNPNL